MNCPFCHASETKVVDSRLISGPNTIKRRRKCEVCQKRFTTFEKMQIDMPMVVKNDGRREEFHREKIFAGLQKACQKRPISTDQIEKIVLGIEKSIVELNDNEIHTLDIGNFVMQHLRDLDPVAYVRFASVYCNFENIDEFILDLKANYQQHNKNRSLGTTNV